MSLEGIEASVREALEQTAPPDDEVVALMRVAEQRRLAANTKRPVSWSQRAFFSNHKLLLASTCACACGAFLWWQGAPRKPQVMMTQDVWSVRTSVDPEVHTVPPLSEPSVARATALVPMADGKTRGTQQPAHPSAKKAVLTPKPPAKTRPSPALSSAAVPTETAELSSKTKPRQPRWEDVAKAMREGRDEQARDLITQLQLSSNAETRDNARLANLQLAIDAQGTTPATPEQLKALKELEQRGTTSSVRASARRLLRRLGSARK